MKEVAVSQNSVLAVFPELGGVGKCAWMLLEGALMVKRFILGRRNRCLSWLTTGQGPGLIQEENSQMVRSDGVGHKINASGAGSERQFFSRK